MPKYMDEQTFITWSHREKAVLWVIEVFHAAHMQTETLQLSINIMDRYLSIRLVPLSSLQLVAAVSMWLALKYEESGCPWTSKHIYQLCADSYSELDVVEMEVRVLNAIEFDLSFPTAESFFAFSFEKLKDDIGSQHHLEFSLIVRFFIESTLPVGEFVGILPKTLADAAIHLAQEAMGLDILVSRNLVPL
jgi:hypothetical protein